MSNSPFVSFLRSLMMMVMLTTILLIAIFWNGLPSMKSDEKLLPVSWKHFFQQDEEKPDQEARKETFAPTKSILIDPVSNDIPSEPEPVINQFDVASPVPPAGVEAELPEDFHTFKRTLEQKYGATEVLLEPWGREGKMYRFSCYISEPRGNRVKKLHQSIQATPALAVQKVLETMR